MVKRIIGSINLKRVVWSTSKFSIRMLGVFFVLGVMMLGWFIWRVSDRPLDISFAKDTIEAAMYDKASGNYARMDKAVLFWPDFKGPLYLQIYNGQFFNKDSVLIGSMGQLDVSFSRGGLLQGRIMPKAVILKQPVLRLVRNKNGSVSIDIENHKSEQEHDIDTSEGRKTTFGILRDILSYIARPAQYMDEENTGSSLMSRLRGFSIENARLLVDDKVIQQTWSLPGFDMEVLSTSDGADGHAHMSLPGLGTEDSALDVVMTYDWEQGDIALSADIKALNVNDILGKIPGLDVPATQDVVISANIETIIDDREFVPSDLHISAYSEGGHIVYSKLSDEPVPYKNMALNTTYNYASKTLLLRDTHISLGGINFEFSGDLTHSEDDVRGPVRVWAKNVQQPQIDKIWPEFLRGKNAEKWIVKRISNGVFEEVSVSFNLEGSKKTTEANTETVSWQAGIENILVDFKARDMTLDYYAPLPKASHIYGSGQLDVDNDSLSIEIEKAKIGEMAIGPSKIYLDELIAVGVGDADLSIDLQGNIADVFRYISTEPINLGNNIDMDIDRVKGKADLKIKLHFPARKNVKLSQFKIDIKGQISDVLFPDVVKDLDISGGPLDLSVKDNLVRLKGNALLDGRRTDLEWEAFLKSEGQSYKEKVQARLRVDDELREKLGIDLTEFFSGPLDTSLTYTSYRDGTAGAEISADMTPAQFIIDPFDYEKPIGVNGNLRLSALLEQGHLRKITNLSAQAPDFMLENAVIDFTTLAPSPSDTGESKGTVVLAGGQIPSFTLGETKASLKFSYDEKRAIDIMLGGTFLDARPFLDAEKKEEEYDAPPMRIKVKADVMRTAPEQVARDVRIYMEIDPKGRFDQAEMDGHIGSSGVFVRYNNAGNEQGKRTFRMKTEDAGALLRAFGLYDNVIGGTMVIYGEPMHWVYDRNIRGRAEITNFKIVKAPALAKMLSLLSLGGVTKALSNDGLNFDKMEADFNWLYRKQGSLLDLKNGRTSGNTLGLLFEGTFDNHKREVDVSGTIAPMDMLNKVLDKIPLVGNLLTGGAGGGVFAATYSIKGSSDDPKVSVNPLSVLTPGILRRILWE